MWPSDPLMSLAYVGIKGGMVIVVCGRSGTDIVTDGAGYKDVCRLLQDPGI